MGISIYYTSTRRLVPDEADAVRSAANRANSGRSWLGSEPVSFFPGLVEGKLVGGSKPNFIPNPADEHAAAQSGLPDAGLVDVVKILAELSADYAVDWQLAHDFGELGIIRSGSADHGLLAQVEAFGGLGDALEELDGEEFT